MIVGKVCWRVWFWEGSPIEDSVPDHMHFESKREANEFAALKKKEKRFGYIVKVELQKNENGNDEWVEVEKHECIEIR